MKLKDLTVTEVISDPRIITMLYNFLKLRIQNLGSYEDLSEEEQKVISRNLWNRITVNNQ